MPAIWLRGAVELRRADHHASLRPRALRQPRHQRAAVLLDALRLLPVHALDLAQHVDEGRLAVARALGEIGAAPERLAGGREEHGERPAAVLAQQMQRRHVDLIDVGALLAVDFDVDEQIVHHARGGVVLEALVRHDVAPMAGRIADREQDRLVAALGLRQRVAAPTATSRRGCACAAGDTGSSPGQDDFHGTRWATTWFNPFGSGGLIIPLERNGWYLQKSDARPIPGKRNYGQDAGTSNGRGRKAPCGRSGEQLVASCSPTLGASSEVFSVDHREAVSDRSIEAPIREARH